MSNKHHMSFEEFSWMIIGSVHYKENTREFCRSSRVIMSCTMCGHRSEHGEGNTYYLYQYYLEGCRHKELRADASCGGRLELVLPEAKETDLGL